MPFAALDDGFHSSKKVVKAGLDGAGLYARALSYCADELTDGFVLLEWAAEVGKPSVRKKVTAADLWVEVAGGETFVCHLRDGSPHSVTMPSRGYFLRGYVSFNPSRLEVVDNRAELSRKRSEAGKKGAQARWNPDGKTDDLPSVSHGKSVATEWPPTPKYLARGESALQFEESSGRQFELNGLPMENEFLSLRLLQAIGDHADQGTAHIVRSHAAKLPQAALAKVIESLGTQPGIRNRAKYAVSALGDELAERENVA